MSKVILAETDIQDIINSLSKQISENNSDKVVLVGISSKGKIIADRIAHTIQKTYHRTFPTGQIDISLFLPTSESDQFINVGQTNIPFSFFSTFCIHLYSI